MMVSKTTRRPDEKLVAERKMLDGLHCRNILSVLNDLHTEADNCLSLQQVGVPGTLPATPDEALQFPPTKLYGMAQPWVCLQVLDDKA